jgi:hypothetical protein
MVAQERDRRARLRNQYERLGTATISVAVAWGVVLALLFLVTRPGERGRPAADGGAQNPA